MTKQIAAVVMGSVLAAVTAFAGAPVWAVFAVGFTGTYLILDSLA